MSNIIIKAKEGYIANNRSSGHCINCMHGWEEGEMYIPIKGTLNGLCLGCVENWDINEA